MSFTPAKLPENVNGLKEIIGHLSARVEDSETRFSAAETQCQEYKEKLHGFAIENGLLREKIRLLLADKYGRRTEKFAQETGQKLLPFFDEAAAGEAEETDAPPAEGVTVPQHQRRKPKRKPLPPELPRIEVVHDIPADEKICGCGGEMVRIGEEVSEQLDIVPAQAQVIRHVRPKYACRSCEGLAGGGPAVKIAEMPEQMIPKSLASPGLLAQVLVSKYADALPFYRQEAIFQRLGIDLTRGVMGGWAMKVGGQCRVLVDLLFQELLAGAVVQMDETRVQVMNEEGRPNTSNSYMWVYRGGPPGKTVIIFQYSPTRAGRSRGRRWGSTKDTCRRTATPDMIFSGTGRR